MRYKFLRLKEKGEFRGLNDLEEEKILGNLILTKEDLNTPYKLIDIHVDFNYLEGINGKNKSHNT